MLDETQKKLQEIEHKYKVTIETIDKEIDEHQLCINKLANKKKVLIGEMLKLNESLNF